MAVETGIAPNDLLDTPPDVFGAMVDHLNARQKRLEREAKRRG